MKLASGTRHEVTVGEDTITYDELGSGPPLILVHGLGGCRQFWIANMEALTDRFRVIAPDLPGFGDSHSMNGDCSIDASARTLDAFAAKLALNRFDVAGFSMGGAVALELAGRAAGQVESLVLVSPVGFSRPTWTVRAMPFVRPAAALVYRPRRVVASSKIGRQLTLSSLAAKPSDIDPSLATELLRGARWTAGFNSAWRSVLGYDAGEVSRRVKCPVLIVAGDEDRQIPVGDYRCMARREATTRTVVFEGTGHMPMVERRDEFDSLVIEFLTGHPSG